MDAPEDDDLDREIFAPYTVPDTSLVAKRSEIAHEKRKAKKEGLSAPDDGVPQNWPPAGWQRDEFPKDYSFHAALAWVRFELNVIDFTPRGNNGRDLAAKHAHVLPEILNDLGLLIQHFVRLKVPNPPSVPKSWMSPHEMRVDLASVSQWLIGLIGSDLSGNSKANIPTSPLSAHGPVVPDTPVQPTPFTGGTLAFFNDRIELCGVNICSGRRSQNRRNVLDALRERRNGRFVAYSQAELLAKTNLKGGGDSIGGLIRDLRDQIQEKLLAVANITCGELDVVLTTEEGYRLADSIKLSVQFDEKKIQGHGEIKNEDADPVNDLDHVPVTALRDPVNPERDPVNNKTDPVNVPVSADGDPVKSRLPDPDDQVARRAWILEQIASGRRFRVPQIANEIGCSEKTVKRDLDALGNEIEFVGAPKTGHYQVRPPQADA